MTELIDEFGIGTQAERAESWRYSQNALRALSQVPFERAQSAGALSDALRSHVAFAGQPHRFHQRRIVARTFRFRRIRR